MKTVSPFSHRVAYNTMKRPHNAKLGTWEGEMGCREDWEEGISSLSFVVCGGVGVLSWVLSTSLYVSLSYVDFFKFSRGFECRQFILLGI